MGSESEPDEPHTTTVQIKTETWAALDKLKERGDSFDDVIRRLIDNTAVGMDGLKAYDSAPGVDTGEIQPIEEAPTDETKGCAHFDVVSGEMCHNEVEYWQPYSFGPDDEGSEFYYCGEHVPDHGG